MTVSFTLATKTKVDAFTDSASIGDIVQYQIDCTPWQEDNTPITSVTWTNDGGGNPGISNQQLVNGIASALINFTQRGYNNIAIIITTATQSKRIWLKVNVIDRSREFYAGDDYGFDTRNG